MVTLRLVIVEVENDPVVLKERSRGGKQFPTSMMLGGRVCYYTPEA